MLSLLGYSGTPKNQKIGDIREEKDFGEQLHDLKGKMETTMSKSKKELKNYRELSKFNEQLAKSYAVNLKVIVEVSKLLNAYNDFFDLFKTKLAEIDQELGIPISSDDFEYMKKLTLEQMYQLDDIFKKETGNLKKLYSKFGKQKEYDDVDNAEKMFNETREAGKRVLSAVGPDGANQQVAAALPLLPTTGGKRRVMKAPKAVKAVRKPVANKK